MTAATRMLALAGALVLASAARAAAIDAPPALAGVGIVDRAGARVPLDVTFVDHDGRRVRLGSYFDGTRPVVLILAYYHCPMLCPLILDGLGRALAAAGRVGAVRVLTISIDPRDRPADARTRRAAVLAALPSAGARRDVDWTFLVDGDGADAADGAGVDAGAGDAADARVDGAAARSARATRSRAVRGAASVAGADGAARVAEADGAARVAEAVGYRYRRDPASGEYAHGAAIFVLRGDGRLARVLQGVAPTAAELVAALDAASGAADDAGATGAAARGAAAGSTDDASATDGAAVGTAAGAGATTGTGAAALAAGLLQCFRYTPSLRRHGGAVVAAFQIGGALILVGFGVVIATARRRARGRRRR